jgi:hypothetical protein
VGVVGREGVESGDELGDEGLLVDGERRVGEDLIGDCRRGADGGGRAAEGPEPVGRVDLRGAGDVVGDAAHRVPLGAGQRLGELGAEQVRASHAAEQQGSTGEQGEVLAVDVHGEGDVVRGVARGVDHPHQPGAGVDLGLVTDPVGGEGDVHAVGDDVLRAEDAGQLEAAADVVVVEVGLQDVGDGPAALVEDLLDPVDVALRVDDDGRRAPPDDVAAVTQVGGLDRDDVEVVHEVATFAPADTRSGYPPVRL